MHYYYQLNILELKRQLREYYKIKRLSDDDLIAISKMLNDYVPKDNLIKALNETNGRTQQEWARNVLRKLHLGKDIW